MSRGRSMISVLISLCIILFLGGLTITWIYLTPVSTTTSTTITAEQLQDAHCANQSKVWDEESHSCLTGEERIRRAEEQWKAEKARIEREYGFVYIPGTAAFKPGSHFWVSPTQEFGNLHEYVVGDDGGIWDSTGELVSASQAIDQYPAVSGPDGTPWFTTHIFKGEGQDGPFIWTFFNVVWGHTGWTPIKK